MKTITRKSKTYPRMYVLILTVLISCTHQRTVEFFVSPEGRDTNPGTEAAPFHSLEKAKESVRSQLRKAPEIPVLVNIKEGTYYLEKSVVFSPEDSGTETASVVYKAAVGEKPVFTGSREVKNWKLLDDAEKLKVLPPEASGKVYVTDVKASGINDFGDPTQIGCFPGFNSRESPSSIYPEKC